MFRGLALTYVLLAALPLAGCSDQACIQWSEDQGVCPSQDEALDYMGGGGASCSQVSSVDSEGEFDGTACCYDVTEQDDDGYYDCALSSVVGAGVTSGVVVSSSSSSSSTGGFQPTCSGDSCSPACQPAIESPSLGACFPLGSSGILCNPVTNEGCDPQTQVCDLFMDEFGTNFLCYPATFVGSCDFGCANWGECPLGWGCLGTCAKYCCDDTDCGDFARCEFGHMTSLGMPGGVCVDDFTGGPGGAGGQGGAGGTGGMGGMGGAPAGGSGGI